MTKQFTITVEYEYGPYEVYIINARDLKSARKKAKDRYMREYFQRRLLKTYKNP